LLISFPKQLRIWGRELESFPTRESEAAADLVTSSQPQRDPDLAQRQAVTDERDDLRAKRVRSHLGQRNGTPAPRPPVARLVTFAGMARFAAEERGLALFVPGDSVVTGVG
jgi:hypothetical protein